MNIGGRLRKVLAHPDRNGRMYLLERATGEVLSAEAFAYQNTSEGVDMKTGRLKIVAAKSTGFRTVRDVCPAPPGGKVDLNQVFQIVLQNCRTAIDETGARVTSDRLPTVEGHEAHFVQLLQNLISNALKYHAAGSPPLIHVSVERQDSSWRVAVKDNGIGIAPEFHQRIFGVFKRLHGRTVPGTGIGLAICKRVVERYGGNIWVSSRENEGATFYFTLPAATQRKAAAHD